ncbi:hypothetical protein [Dyella sp.]|uniref:hypothetical protein n=1 Tax=Dyella sp. TaxID=1869338 RepID=UPI002B4A2129|nr:hypothetical protein [Dyella sp.]HKT26561.1 hypothetical protein [Dyella sp.]
MNESNKKPIYINRDLLLAVSKVLRPGETAIGFIEEVLQKGVAWREDDRLFFERALASRDEARESGKYVSSDEVIAKLDGILKRRSTGET